MSLIPILSGVITGSGGGGGGGGSIPHDMASLQHWYNVADLSALANNDPVGTWPDAKGSADATITGTKRPLYKTNSGDPYVDFDGSDDELQVTLSAMNDFAYCMVVEIPSDTVDYARILEDGSLQLFTTTSGGSRSMFFYIVGTPGITDSSWLATPTGVIALYIERSGLTGKLRINGTEYTGSHVSTATGTTLHIGAYTSAGYNQTMKLRELLIFDNNLSPSEFTDLAGYINDTWGLTL